MRFAINSFRVKSIFSTAYAIQFAPSALVLAMAAVTVRRFGGKKASGVRAFTFLIMTQSVTKYESFVNCSVARPNKREAGMPGLSRSFCFPAT